MSLWHALVIVLILGAVLTLVPILVWEERKVSARIQNRRGPNRVGPFGLLQPIVDAIKLLAKEEVIPAGAERFLYYAAPLMAFVPAGLAFAVIPVGNAIAIDAQMLRLAIADLDIGILFVIAISSLGVYGLVFGGWTANSKYPLLGGLRASAQLVSYEVAMGLAIVVVLLSSGSVRMDDIVLDQQRTLWGFFPLWNVFRQPIAALIFVVAAFAENNRLPFDLPEAEPELVGGYHTEYSGMKFGMFFMGEYVAMIAMSAVMVTLFFGGWGLPGIDPNDHSVLMGLITAAIFFAKVGLLTFFYIWVRWTLPRFRYDQLMRLGWKALIPLGLANILVTGLLGLWLG